MSSIKNALVAVAVGIPVLYLVMPQERLDRLGQTFNRVTNDKAQACLDYERKGLKDPSSARLVGEPNAAADVVRISYQAKNGYGAYGDPIAATCVVVVGKVDEDRTKSIRLGELIAEQRSNAQENLDKLKDQNACLARRNRLVREGMSTVQADATVGKCE